MFFPFLLVSELAGEVDHACDRDRSWGKPILFKIPPEGQSSVCCTQACPGGHVTHMCLGLGYSCRLSRVPQRCIT